MDTFFLLCESCYPAPSLTVVCAYNHICLHNKCKNNFIYKSLLSGASCSQSHAAIMVKVKLLVHYPLTMGGIW